MTPRVIVVDDDFASASVLAKLLRRLGCEVTACTDPEAALPLALGGDIDLVSLDLTMPGLDGYQTLTLIRSHEHSRRAPSVPVITVTGRVTADDRADALADGFAAHLGKPVLLEALRGAMARALTLRSELHRTRYTADRASIEDCLQQLHPGAAGDQLRTAAGMALAVEQQGRLTLQRTLRLALGGQPESAQAPLQELSRLANALGARRLRGDLDVLADQLGRADEQALETAAVLARAELDRVIFTLREQVLS
ncbi:MAG: response regulator [Rubrivivax sp.]|nr:response regulator [Rubrivivax sp.]